MKNLFFAFILLFGAVNVFAQTKDPPPQVARITMGVINSRATSLPKPAYPPAAKAVRAGGSVNVEVTYDENGDVISAKAVSGHPLLQQAAVAAARQAKFTRTLVSGQPVKVTGIVVYNFEPSPATPAAGQNKSKELVLYTGLSMFLTALKDIEPDEEANDILRELANSFPPVFASEKAQLNRLASAKRSEHERIIDEFINSFGRKLSGTQLWLFDFGKYWGTALGQAYKLSNDNLRGDKVKFIDNINKMTALINSAPKDIPENILEKIRKVALVGDEDDLVSQEFINDFFRASFEFMELIAPEENGNGTN
ncbi:MAG TPA: TonB family protein [Pyrinomonadaceae bacterium]|nr:TonB family protein [Pyrinomonadaceae bacterium]